MAQARVVAILDKDVMYYVLELITFVTQPYPQYYPWAAWIIGGRFGALVFNIVRVIILTPLLLVYGLWAQVTYYCSSTVCGHR